jgi:hypothetical protein
MFALWRSQWQNLSFPMHQSAFSWFIHLILLFPLSLGGTRTCIHTPGAPMDPSEMTPQLIESALADACLVYFDGRLTEAALLLARAAKRKGLPVLVEAERLRPGLELLLAEADYVVTSAHFPQVRTRGPA